MPEKVRIGMIGSGGIARYHLKLFLEMPEAEVVALADPASDQIAETHKRFDKLKSTPVFDDYRQMLREAPMDAVCISTPHTMHRENMMDAFEAGKHIFIEKPMVSVVQEAKEIIRMFESDPKRVGVVGYQRHYQGPFRYMREGIASGEIGAVQYLNALQCQDWLNGTRGSWRQDPALSGGGQVNDSGSHIMDILLWVTQLSVTKVSAFQEFYDSKVDIDSAVSIIFENGALGTISIVGNAPEWYEDFTIVGSKGAYYYRNGAIAKHVRGGERTTPSDLPSSSSPDSNFVQAILGRETVQSPISGALRVIELTEAIWDSAGKGGATVEVERT